MRSWDLPPLLRLVAAGGTALAAAIGLAWASPRFFLGEDGRWMLDVVRGYLPARLDPSRPPLA